MRLILIGGAQRSGTTLLQTLIANTLDTPVLPEDHILCDLLTSYRRAKEFAKKTCYFYRTDAELLNYFRLCADRHIVDVVKATKPGPWLVIKDPNLSRVEDEAFAVFPDSIRDPRDIAASFIRIGERQRNTEPIKYSKRELAPICSRIEMSYRTLLSRAPDSRLFLVRYESLASEPQRTLETLGRQAGLDLSFDLLSEPSWLPADARHQQAWITELEGQKPSAASVGSYRSVLRPSDVIFVEAICEDFMVWAGYERSGLLPATRPKRLTHAIYRRLKRLYRAANPRSPVQSLGQASD